VFIAVTGNRHWAGLCDALGFDDWKSSPEFNTNRKRSALKLRIAERVEEAVKQYTYDEITAKLHKRLVPYAPVNTPKGLLSEKHLNEAERWLLLRVPGHDLKVPKLPIDLQRTDAFDVRHQPANLGEHTDAILAELGYAPAEIERLKAEKVVLRSDRMLTDLPAGE